MISFDTISFGNYWADFDDVYTKKKIDKIAGKYVYYLTYPFVCASYFFTYRTLAKIVE